MSTGSSPQIPTRADIAETAENLPPPRRSKPMKSVSPPLSSTPLNKFVYILVLTTTLLAAFYCYRIVQYKTAAGGWVNYALGRHPSKVQAQGNSTPIPGPGQHIVEERINALAEALGMPSDELASAIAGAVRQYVPPASLSSIAAKETGTIVQVLLNKEGTDEWSAGEKKSASEGAPGVVEGVVSGVGSFVGMDEP